MKRFLSLKIFIIIIAALLLGVTAVPQAYQPSWIPDWVKNIKMSLGLDLQGGSQLDYKVDLRKVPLADHESIVEGVKEVINRRVNGLGVSEPNIYISQVANESHIIVELAGIKDLEEAKGKIGKTVQLEFKEQKTVAAPEEKAAVKKQAEEFLKEVRKDNFDTLAEEESKAYPSKVIFQKAKEDFQFKEDFVDQTIFETALKYQKGDIIEKLLEGNNGYIIQGQEVVPSTGYFVVRVEDKKENVNKEVKEGKKVFASHALIAYKGAERASETVTRTKDEAKKLALDLLQKIKSGETTLAETAKSYSDEPGAKDSAGKLNEPVADNGMYVQEFTDAALKLKKGEVSGIVETAFGFHILYADDVTEASNSTVQSTQLRLSYVFFSDLPDPWIETELTGEHFVHADVQFDQLYQPYISIKFNTEGAKLFETITERNVNKPLAIFVGGDMISAPNVNEKISGGSAIITGRFSIEEATTLARDLNTGAIPAPVTLAGQYTIGATLGEDALQKSIFGGILGLLILTVFMILYYRLPGLLAVAALTIYSIILLFIIKVELPLIVALAISVTLFLAIVVKIINSQDSGWEKFISFILACFILFFFTFILSGQIILTLAGVAGLILSIGMAVDANILIFERIKEELTDGRPLSSAIEIGFDRAWSSIRDSNFSSLITCAILAYFGTSIIRGFALNLAAGILISMFTAITITKTFLLRFIGTKFDEKLWLFGKKEKRERAPLRIIENTKIWFGFSGLIIVIGIIATIMNGLNLGIDFRGGALLDIKFVKPTTPQAITETIKEVEKKFVEDNKTSFIPKALAQQIVTPEATPSVTASPELKQDEKHVTKFGTPVVVSSGENSFIIRMEYITEEEHNAILAALKAKLGELEESRFTTVGPMIGSALKQKAIFALGLAMIGIILYIAFAFRHVPKKINPWRFGVCAILALIHDVLFTVGIFAILGLEIDALFITALLTIIGFSVHDTIVVFDRIREHLKKESADNFTELVNKSVTQTMARSINTSLSTLFTLIALFIFGSESIHWFVFALIIGITIGTYSSIFIASPLVVIWKEWAEKKSS